MSLERFPEPLAFPGPDPLDELAKRALEGDTVSQGQLLEALMEPLWRWMVRLVGTGGQGGYSPEDLVQEGLTKIWRRLHQYQAGRPFRPWAARVARNHALDLLRSKAAQNQSKETAFPEHLEPAAPVSSQKDFSLSRMLAQLVARLPENQRACLLFREREGWSYRDIAQVLGSTESTVRNHVMLAKRKLRQWLQEIPGKSAGESD